MVLLATLVRADIPVVKQQRSSKSSGNVQVGFESASVTVGVIGVSASYFTASSDPELLAPSAAGGRSLALIDPQTDLVNEVEKLHGESGVLDHNFMDLANPFNS